MDQKPIYVEIVIKTDMEKLWQHTQTPELHQQWDLRFTEITYLPRDRKDERQKFQYRTRIGFGINIAGTGETKATVGSSGGTRAFVHYLSVSVIAFLWIYQGLVPKLLYPQSGESLLLKQTSWFPGWEEAVLPVVGVLELGFGILLCLLHRHRTIFHIQGFLLLVLATGAIMGTPELLRAPFSPITLNLAIFGLGMVAAATIRDLPDAARCLRKAVKVKRMIGGEARGIHL
jgi:hypothetical protein